MTCRPSRYRLRRGGAVEQPHQIAVCCRRGCPANRRRRTRGAGYRACRRRRPGTAFRGVEASAGNVSVTRGTNGSMPALVTPTHPALFFFKRARLRKQRCGMAVGAEPHEHKIEQRPCRIEPVGAVKSLAAPRRRDGRRLRDSWRRSGSDERCRAAPDAIEKQPPRHAHIAAADRLSGTKRSSPMNQCTRSHGTLLRQGSSASRR